MFKQVNDKYINFTSAGHLMELSQLVQLPKAAQARIKELAAALSEDIKSADERLIQFKLSSEYPVTEVDKSQVEYFELNVSPKLYEIDCLASEEPENLLDVQNQLSELDFTDSTLECKSTDIYKFVLIKIVNEILSRESDGEEDYQEIYFDSDDVDFESLKNILMCLKSNYFDPLGWVERGKQANLLFSSQDVSKYPFRIRARVVEVFRTYVSGYNFACVATCRSLLEFVLVDRAKSNTKWKLDPYTVNRKGEKEIKRLSQLCEEFSDISPELDLKLNFIRRKGNSVLHVPTNHKKEEFPPHNKTARDCLMYVFEVIEELYG